MDNITLAPIMVNKMSKEDAERAAEPVLKQLDLEKFKICILTNCQVGKSNV